MKRLFTLAVLLCFLVMDSAVNASDKSALTDHYKHKYLVVLRDGLAVGICSAQAADGADAPALKPITVPSLFRVAISGETAAYKPQTGFGAQAFCGGPIMPEPLHKGEVLRVVSVGSRRGIFGIGIETISAHQVERGIGAFAHQSYEHASAALEFADCTRNDDADCQTGIEKWVKVFDTQEDAAKFGNANAVIVKEVKLGMTFTEVETAIGPPATKADLGEKILYKYKDMTVEFHDGKVTDVR